ncbi:hypothetical protein EJ08DRAFT_648945 [Tothia fuscella]|uniref:Malate dehydrogenase n=1 Tax=Tothia fuscella TaxID=1048955 RepID=A0A9P4TYG9_9PEZI|nr:hypothetical protein EJ08DRAFT_648945 [Tothia fuscella]
MYLQSSLALLAALSPFFATSAPALDRREADILNIFEERFAEASAATLLPRTDNVAVSSTCNLASIKMPNTSPVALPPPAAGLALSHISIGRGTQNYTCADENAAPVAAGAVATLFNVTCLAGPYPGLLSSMSKIALKFPTPNPANIMTPANMFLSGQHYFPDLTTPFFDLSTATHNYGSVGCKKLNGTDAPNKATDVPWLRLGSKSRDGCTISEVYRLNTAGGQPPATCKGMGKAFQVQYAAEYWFWDNPTLSAYA